MNYSNQLRKKITFWRLFMYLSITLDTILSKSLYMPVYLSLKAASSSMSLDTFGKGENIPMEPFFFDFSLIWTERQNLHCVCIFTISHCKHLHFRNNKACWCQITHFWILFANVMNMPLKFWNKNQIPTQGKSNLV